MKNAFITAVCLAALVAPAFGAQSQVTAKLEPQSIVLGESAQLTVTSNGATQLSVPNVDGLEMEPIGQQTSIQMINGNVTANVEQLFSVTPNRVGDFTIPPIGGSGQPIKLHVDNGSGGQTQRTAPQSRSHLPAPSFSQRSNSATVDSKNQSAFLRIELPKQELTVGELVPVKVKAYFRAGVSASLNGLPTLSTDAFTLNKVDDNPEQTNEMIDGVPYTVVTWTSALSAVKAGDYPLTLDLPVIVRVQEKDAGVRGGREPGADQAGLRPGQTLAVEDAIKGLVTKSANDASVVIAEALGGSQSDFAEMMTRKARAIGMANTTYRNASGLPNDEQITTARDQALLGIAIQQRFPKYYRYFSLTSFVYRGSSMRNHNHLLGRVEGVDGIKTGFTNASGFNLVTSVKRGYRHIVAVVLGGRSAGSRDARMRELISETIVDASSKPTLTLAAETPSLPPLLSAFAKQENKPQVTEAEGAPVALAPAWPPFVTEATAAVPAGSDAPIKPVKVKTFAVKLVPSKTAAPGTTAPSAAEVTPPDPATTRSVRQRLARPKPRSWPRPHPKHRTSSSRRSCRGPLLSPSRRPRPSSLTTS